MLKVKNLFKAYLNHKLIILLIISCQLPFQGRTDESLNSSENILTKVSHLIKNDKLYTLLFMIDFQDLLCRYCIEEFVELKTFITENIHSANVIIIVKQKRNRSKSAQTKLIEQWKQSMGIKFQVTLDDRLIFERHSIEKSCFIYFNPDGKLLSIDYFPMGHWRLTYIKNKLNQRID